MKQSLLLTCAAWLMACFLAVPAFGETMSVQVKSGDLRSTPSFLGKILKSLPYGTAVEVAGDRGDWINVSGAGKTGWMHHSALTKKKIVMKAGAAEVDQYATSDELSLAGKGFNEEVEDAFKARNADADFTWIDRMEGFTVSQSEMVQFLKTGNVKP